MKSESNDFYRVAVPNHDALRVPATSAEEAVWEWKKTIGADIFGTTLHLTVSREGEASRHFSLFVPARGVRTPPTLKEIPMNQSETASENSWEPLRLEIFTALAAEAQRQDREAQAEAARVRLEEEAHVRQKLRQLPEKLRAALRARNASVVLDELERDNPRAKIRGEIYREACAKLGLEVEVEYSSPGRPGGVVVVYVPSRDTLRAFLESSSRA